MLLKYSILDEEKQDMDGPMSKDFTHSPRGFKCRAGPYLKGDGNEDGFRDLKVRAHTFKALASSF